MCLLDKIFSLERESYKNLNKIKSARLEQNIEEINKKQKQIQESIIMASNPDLIQHLEKEWQEWDARKKSQTSSADIDDKQRIKKMAIRSHSLFVNP